MYEEKLHFFLSEKKKKHPYISFNLSPRPFEQPSFVLKFFLEHFITPKEALKLTSEFFPIETFGKVFSISFTVEEFGDSDAKKRKKEPVRQLIMEIEHLSDYNEAHFKSLCYGIDRLLERVKIIKQLKGTFYFSQGVSGFIPLVTFPENSEHLFLSPKKDT